jgi:glutathione S-transferase
LRPTRHIWTRSKQPWVIFSEGDETFDGTANLVRVVRELFPMSLVLYGFRYSVYVRVARIALAEKGLAYEHVGIDPFAVDAPTEYLDLHPFNRVPTLVDGNFVLYETEAITRYIDEAFSGPMLQPAEPRHRARMSQIISIIDSYGYVPMVRQVAGERVFAPLAGRKPDEARIRMGLEMSRRVLAALEAITCGDRPLAGGQAWSLADFHLAPMLAYFTAASEGAIALAGHRKLSMWWQVFRERQSVQETDPDLSRYATELGLRNVRPAD